MEVGDWASASDVSVLSCYNFSYLLHRLLLRRRRCCRDGYPNYVGYYYCSNRRTNEPQIR
jgi:hypothetical protein